MAEERTPGSHSDLFKAGPSKANWSRQPKSTKTKQARSLASSPISTKQLSSDQHVFVMEERNERQINQYVPRWDDLQPGYSEHAAWIEELFSSWCNATDVNLASTLLRRYFNSSTDPYRTALYLMSQAPDFHSNKANTTASALMNVFENWLLQNDSLRTKHIPLQLQYDAFDLMHTQSNANLTQLVFNIYRLKESSVQFVDRIGSLIVAKHYKQAALFASLLNVQNYFDIRQILIPLILQDKVNLVQTYLENCPEQRACLVSFIDSMSTSSSNVNQLITQLQVPHARPEKWNWRAFKKLGTRLMKLYNLPTEICPNICQINNTGALKYLLHKKYNEGSISDETWDEMVEATIKDDPQLQIDLIYSLARYDDLSCAVKYALKYNITFDSLPFAVQNALGENKAIENKSGNENWDSDINEECGQQRLDKNEYYTLTLPRSAIIFVETKTSFLESMQVIRASDIIGIDCEWKPTFGLTNEKLAVIQIATWDLIFLLDVISLTHVLEQDDWHLLIYNIFCNSDITKLGFGINCDLKMIARLLPVFEQLLSTAVCVIDLNSLAEKLQEVNPNVFPFGGVESGGKGLTNLVQMCFGKALDKKEQFSNWEKRPLRLSQKIYAALDAYCLLEIYKHLNEVALKNEIDWSSMIKATCNPGTKKNKQSKKTPKPASQPEVLVENTESPVSCEKPAGQFSVIVDTMLQGLGRQLRLMGIDTIISDSSYTQERILQVALRENRVILTSGQPYERLRQYVPPGMCFKVNQIHSARQQVNEVLHFYKIRVTPKDIFSRCQICNSNRYIKTPSDTVEMLWKKDNLIERRNSNASTWKKSSILTFDGGKIDIINLTTDQGARLQFDGLSQSVFSRVNLFYICSSCGKVYWEGSHLKRSMSSLKTILQNTSELNDKE